MNQQTIDTRAPVGAAAAAEVRQRRVAEAVAASIADHFVPWRGAPHRLPVARLPQGLLVYRVDNGRLIAELAELAHGRGQNLADIAARQDSAETQRLLHGLLLAKAADPAGPVYQELRRAAVQTEPLLITADGVVVNGNRRLAAMRELLAEDPVRFAAFAEVEAAVLPAEAAAADLESVEAALQMAPETKLGYGWINRRLKLRRQREELGLTPDQLVEAYRLEDTGQIDRELDELALAEDYLANFTGDPEGYASVADAEVLFTGLAQRLAGLQPDVRAVWRLAGFTLINGRASVDGPMDRQFPFAQPVPPHRPTWTLRRFAEERDMLSAKAQQGEGLDGATRDNLNAVFGDPQKSDTVAPELYGLMERLRSEFQVERSPQRVLKMLEKVRQSMDDLPRGKVTEQQLRRMRGETAALQAQISDLLGDFSTPPAAEPEAQSGLAGRLARALHK